MVVLALMCIQFGQVSLAAKAEPVKDAPAPAASGPAPSDREKARAEREKILAAAEGVKKEEKDKEKEAKEKESKDKKAEEEKKVRVSLSVRPDSSIPTAPSRGQEREPALRSPRWPHAGTHSLFSPFLCNSRFDSCQSLSIFSLCRFSRSRCVSGFRTPFLPPVLPLSSSRVLTAALSQVNAWPEADVLIARLRATDPASHPTVSMLSLSISLLLFLLLVLLSLSLSLNRSYSLSLSPSLSLSLSLRILSLSATPLPARRV